ncbi:MAG: hypothetical protein BWY43_00300 [candidate division WS2 bacterium ADurb.Bin280]|uniref:Uncharacterized protein n=1 Tax=candidate division WS2 bacterium ADurb.Bin280 TaxID=1852829 RepID=A0A1V5SEF9_9BACT|nr:MAG: hypothetical protein BWY43_00300 [candidate division WS2 bacterium ADurb.Bin280]
MGETFTPIDIAENTETTPETNEGGSVLLFDEMLDKQLTGEEKEEAKIYLSYYQRWKALAKTNTKAFLEIYETYSDFFENDDSDKISQEEAKIRNCKIFHLFSGSSLYENQWRALPLTDEGGVFKDFIENQMVPLIEKYEVGSESVAV